MNSGMTSKNPAAITLPLSGEATKRLKAGEEVILSGTIYTARDAAHGMFYELLTDGKPLPVDLSGQVIFYAGPAPARPGRPSGSIGPTTSYRMDPYTPALLRNTGLRGMIGKGPRSDEVVQAIVETGAVYFAALGGAAALYAASIVSSEIICYPELGTEAVRKLIVKNMPLIVAIDCNGNDVYRDGPDKFVGPENLNK